MSIKFTRRTFIAAGAGAVAAPYLMRGAWAQANEPIRLASLTPNTGGGSPFGPEIAQGHKVVVDLVNKAGGVLGRQIVLTQENSETNPEAAVRAARKLIDADKVMAILGTWSSSVTMGIAPLCQDANVLQFCTSSSEDLPKADKKGLLFSLQALNGIWGTAIARLAIKRGFKEVAAMGINNDFTTSMFDTFGRNFAAGGGKVVNTPFLYNANQPSYRAEVDKLLQGNPKAIFVCAYVTDFTAVYREIFRSGYKGQVITTSLATGPQFKSAVGAAANGILHGFPVPPVGKDTYDAYLRLVGKAPNGQVQNPFGCAGYDMMNVLLLAIESAKSTKVDDVKKHVHMVANGPGERVTTFAQGVAALKAGKKINYDGASSSVDFQPNGMLASRDFELYEIREGKDVSVDRINAAG
ncbi:MAG: ABC transporter substrate-binding protein [Alphaproteobacteria bacterium]